MENCSYIYRILRIPVLQVSLKFLFIVSASFYHFFSFSWTVLAILHKWSNPRQLQDPSFLLGGSRKFKNIFRCLFKLRCLNLKQLDLKHFSAKLPFPAIPFPPKKKNAGTQLFWGYIKMVELMLPNSLARLMIFKCYI